MPSGFSAALDDAIIPNVAVLFHSWTSGTGTVIGVSDGGFMFEPQVELDNINFDGKRSKIELLDRKIDIGARMTGTLINFDNTSLNTYHEPGSSLATAGTPTVVTVTPAAASSFLGTGAYLTNVALVFDRGDGKDVAYVFPKGICTQYTVESRDKDKAKINLTIEARLANATAASSTDTAPYQIQVIG